MLIPGGFKSCDFVSADCRGLAGGFFVSAHCKGLAEAAMSRWHRPAVIDRRRQAPGARRRRARSGGLLEVPQSRLTFLESGGLHRPPLDWAQDRRRSRRPDRNILAAGSVPQPRTRRALQFMVPQRSCQRFLVLRVFSAWKRKHSKRLAPRLSRSGLDGRQAS